ncbi:MAG: outer membrane protein assembly factor BamB [Gammaproteobacteria bacterium]
MRWCDARKRARWLFLLLAASMLGGCGTTKELGKGISKSIGNWMGGEDNSAPPTPLEEFAPTVAVKQLWSTSVGKGTDEQFLKLEPTLVGDRIYTAERRGRVGVYKSATGQNIWTTDLDERISGGPGVGEGLVLVGTSEGEIVALNEADGKQRWRSAVSSEVLAPPRAASGVVVVHTGDGSITALDAADGKRLWSYERATPTLTLRGSSAPLIADDLVIAGFDNGRLVALDIKSGKVEWEAIVAVSTGRSDLDRMVDIDGEPLRMGDTIYVATFQGRVAAVSLISGEVRWARDFSSYAGIAVDDSYLYLTDASGVIWAFDRETGSAVWRQEKLRARAPTAGAIAGDYLVIGDLEGYLHWLRRSDGQFAARARVDESRIIAPPVSDGGTVYAYSSDGDLSAFASQ